MNNKESVEQAAEESALESAKDGDGCTKDNHVHDCLCGAHEEGFIAGANWQRKHSFSIEDMWNVYAQGVSEGRQSEGVVVRKSVFDEFMKQHYPEKGESGCA